MPNKINVDEDYFLLDAVKSGKEDQVRNILGNGCYRNRDYKDGNGKTAVHWATEYGYIKIAYLLIDSDWNVNLTDEKCQTPLHIACNHRRSDIAMALLIAGCDVNASDDSGNTPLQRAIHNNLDTVVYMLCEKGAFINTRNKNNWTPLHEAVRVGNEQIVDKLINSEADVNAVTAYKATPFSTAIFYYRIAQRNTYPSIDSVLEKLIHNRCRLSQCDGQWSPLLSAISICNSHIAGMLLWHGCLIDTSMQYSRNLLVDAFARCEPAAVKLLVLCGYNLTFPEVEQCHRRIPTFSRSFRRLVASDMKNGTHGVQIMVWLRERAENALTLSEICRISIRKSLNHGAGDTSILKNIDHLPLPKCLKKFIRMEEFEHAF